MILIRLHVQPPPDPVTRIRTPRPSPCEQSTLAYQTRRSHTIKSDMRSAYRTLSNPHALATSCWVSTCRQVSW